MISAVSDFSGLDGMIEAHQEPAPVVARFSHIPEFPQLLPEVRAELEEIQAAMDSARVAREAEVTVKSTVLVDEVSNAVDKIVEGPSNESVDSDDSIRAQPVADTVRGIQFKNLRSEVFEILSDDENFPAYHVKIILDLS